MTAGPRSLAVRIALALVFAAVAVAALDRAVDAWERPPPPARRAQGLAPPRDEGAARPAFVAPALPVARPVAGRVVLARRAASLPRDVVPVLEVLPDGAVVLRRPAPLPQRPAAPAVVSRDGYGAAVLVPDSLDRLAPSARGSLLALLDAWIEERPAPPARLVAVDFDADPALLARLLSWLP